MSAFWSTFKRDFALMWSAGGGVVAPLGFFLGAAALVPLAMGPAHDALAAAGPPLLWVAAAFAVLATIERLFQADLEDGSLDQMLLSSAPLELIVLAKGLALWCAIGAPIALAAAPVAIALQASPSLVPAIVVSVALGMGGFVGAGLTGAALTASVKRGSVLIALIVMPFFAPPIIFGSAVASSGFGAAFLLLAGCALAYLVLGTFAAAAALRLQAE